MSSNVVPGHQLRKNCYEEAIKTLKKSNPKSENEIDFFCKQLEINNFKEKLSSSFENIDISPIEFHSIQNYQYLSVAKNKLEKTIKAYENNL